VGSVHERDEELAAVSVAALPLTGISAVERRILLQPGRGSRLGARRRQERRRRGEPSRGARPTRLREQNDSGWAATIIMMITTTIAPTMVILLEL
jgi:hypothetical protein